MTSVILDRLQSAIANRYELKRELARGGMGQVFEARDLKHGRPVAIKVLDPELAAAIGPTRFSGRDRDRRAPLSSAHRSAVRLGRGGRLDEARAALKQLEVRSKSEYVSWERFAYAYLGLDELIPLRRGTTPFSLTLTGHL